MTVLMERAAILVPQNKPGVHTTLDISIAELESSVRGVNYPAGKWELVSQAKENRATGDVLAFLHLLPEGNYKHSRDLAFMAWSYLLI